MRPVDLRIGLALVPFLAGCATIVEGTGQSINVATNPPGAACSVERAGTKLGDVTNTPGSIRVNKSKNGISVVCKKDGYEDARATHTPKFVGTTFGNIILGGAIGIAVDAATGANYAYPEEVKLDLPQKAQPGPAPIVLKPAAPDV